MIHIDDQEEPLWTPSTAWSVMEDLRIGEALGADDAFEFGNVTGLDVDARGQLYVLDQLSQTVRVFGPSGESLRSFGRPGSGPGELAGMLRGLFVRPDGLVIVPDPGNRRVNIYQTDGSFVSSFSVGFEYGFPIRWDLSPTGDVLLQARALPVPGNEDSGDRLVALDLEGSLLATVAKFAEAGTVGQGAPGSVTMFSPETVWDVAQDGTLITASTDEYRLEFRKEGKLERVMTRDHVPVPISRSDGEKITKILEARMPHLPYSAQMMGAVRYAEHYPALARVLAGPGGSVWVQESLTADNLDQGKPTINPLEMGGPKWEVFDNEGRFLGTLDLPARFELFQVTDHSIYGVQFGEDDVQYVVRLKLVRPQEDQGGDVHGGP